MSKVLQSSVLPLVHVSIIPDSKIFFHTNIGDSPCTLLIFLYFFFLVK